MGPMVLVLIYPDGWVETRSTDDVTVRIQEVPALRGRGTQVEAEHGISGAALSRVYRELPVPWQQLVKEVDARNVQSGLPNSMPEEVRAATGAKWAMLETFAAAVKADDHLRLDLYKIHIPQWMKDHAEKVRLGRVGQRWRETYRDERQGV